MHSFGNANWRQTQPSAKGNAIPPRPLPIYSHCAGPLRVTAISGMSKVTRSAATYVSLRFAKFTKIANFSNNNNNNNNCNCAASESILTIWACLRLHHRHHHHRHQLATPAHVNPQTGPAPRNPLKINDVLLENSWRHCEKRENLGNVAHVRIQLTSLIRFARFLNLAKSDFFS